MTENNESTRAWMDFLPQSGAGRLGLALVIVLAFSLGALLTGGGGDDTRRASESAAESRTDEPEVWTCSMHPQVQLPKAGKCPICFMDLIPLEVGSEEDLGPRQLQMTESAKKNARIVTVEAHRALAEAEIRLVGKLAYDETKLAYITAWVPGRLDRLYADFTGITVRKGDHMVYMYSPELLASQEELLQAKIAVTALSIGSEILRETATKTLEATREKLHLFGLSKKQISEIEETGSVSDHLTINAPIGGVVVHKNAAEGIYVKTGTRIYTIADLSQLWVIFEAYESDLPWLRYGQKIEFTTPSFPGRSFSARITFIAPTLDKTTRTVDVRAIFDNSAKELKPDMFVSGVVKSRINSLGEVVEEDFAGKWICPMHPEVVEDSAGDCDICGMPLVSAESLGYANSTEGEETALLIPASAPLLTGLRSIVYVELPDRESPVFEGREVQLGPRAGDWYVVVSGIEEGERVVVNGAFKIDAELQIRAKPSMMLPEGGGGPAGHQHGAPTKPSEEANHEEHASSGESEPKSAEISEQARESLAPLYQAYFKIQEALAADNNEAAVISFKQLSENVSSVDMTLFAGDAHLRWMEISKELSAHSQAGAVAADIKASRVAFEGLSRATIELQKTFGHAEGKDYFLTFCPMANGNKGARWLQTVDTVYNSFYGASMLRCGSIKETFRPAGN